MGIGRTDGPGGDYNMLISNIRNKLLTLPAQTVVLPGHGPKTTIAQERHYNPFLR
jgi:glyoxylase-like metal-dependent hydrolase (beta-lactamase superfamily II)